MAIGTAKGTLLQGFEDSCQSGTEFSEHRLGRADVERERIPARAKRQHPDSQSAPDFSAMRSAFACVAPGAGGNG